MNAEIITIGDEILIGQIIDTNSAFIAKALNRIGVSVFQITSIQDDEDHIVEALNNSRKFSQLTLITGGLGPTKDDITKKTLCSYTGDELVLNELVLGDVETIFRKYISTPISELNRQQAMVPSKCEVLRNEFGTAPGMWFNHNGHIIVSLPGVPYEMKALIDKFVIPKIQENFNLPFIAHKTLMTYGLGESAIAERLDCFEEELPNFIKLAYLPNLGKVRLRLSAKNSDKTLLEKNLNQQVAKLLPLVSDIFVGYEDEGDDVTFIAKLLLNADKTLSVAESCTGGSLAERITTVPGASEYFKGGVVVYSSESKHRLLGVKNETIEQYSVVSKEVAEEMALGALKQFKSDFAIATTGNAGPTKGESDAEIGTVFISIASKDSIKTEKYIFGNQRVKVIGKAVNKAFEMLIKEISKK
ncbi:competence/damage-inducible protein A [Aegicerativicinus sediminis]|uniref:competence/damage-inducible protein A n=1 Tax=Aegicerativicinus sediminis TaxID=2893202 RepID=UPI001E6179A6|nr:competence/damage-inducible protein A [Aegicerativicinus sediminis]